MGLCRCSALLLALCPALQIAALAPSAVSPWRTAHGVMPSGRGARHRHVAPGRRAAGASGVRMGDAPGEPQGSGPAEEADDLERVVLKAGAPGPQPAKVQWEKRVLEATRRSALGALSLSAFVGYVKIYGESEKSLRLYDSLDAALRRATGRPLAGVTQERVRAPLDATFAQLVADAIEHVATAQLQLDGASLRSAETAIAAKAVRLFPVADPSSVSQAIESGDWATLSTGTPAASNLALYSRLRALEERLPSPKSRKDFSAAVGARILQQLRAWNSDLDAAIDACVDAGARDCDLWLGALEKLLGLYSAAGYGVAAIGENGTGLLDTATWREDTPMTGSLSVFVYLVVFNDAAQVLAGEAVDDLAAALLPGPVLAAFFDCLGIEADAQSFYLSSRYRRNPADYRPDSVALILNLSA